VGAATALGVADPDGDGVGVTHVGGVTCVEPLPP
jgi:hypothetical protein